MAIDLQGGSALHLSVQGAERFVVAGEVETRYLPGRDPKIQHYGPYVVKRPGEQLFVPIQNVETRPFQLVRSSGVSGGSGARDDRNSPPPVPRSSIEEEHRMWARRSFENSQEGSASTKRPRKTPKSQPSKGIWPACRINRS